MQALAAYICELQAALLLIYKVYEMVLELEACYMYIWTARSVLLRVRNKITVM
jgi:hypothetical protein